eukprot:2476086-Prymnesium_polylepis.2
MSWKSSRQAARHSRRRRARRRSKPSLTFGSIVWPRVSILSVHSLRRARPFLLALLFWARRQCRCWHRSRSAAAFASSRRCRLL